MRLASVLLVLGSWMAVSQAQPSPAAESPEAIFEAGVRAMERQDWVAAEVIFRQAYQADPNPRVQLNLAESLFQQNELLAARYEASAVARSDDLLLRDAAQVLLERIDAGFARLRLRASGLAAGLASFRVDGRPVDASMVIVLDPGEHAVALFNGERFVSDETVTLRRGEERELTMEPDLSPEATAEANHGDHPPQLRGGPVERARRRRRLALGITAAIVIVGAVALGVGFGLRGNDEPGGDVDAIVFELGP